MIYGDFADDSIHDVGEKPQNNAALFVSLYIVLLAFFILLNSISKISDDKVDAAMDSVSEAFDIKRSISDLPSLDDGVGAEITQTDAFGEIEKLLAKFVPLDEVEMQIDGNLMQVSIPSRQIFIKQTNNIDKNIKNFLSEIAKLSAATIVDDKYNGEMQIEAIISPLFKAIDDLDSDERKLLTSRAAIIAKYMADAGSAASFISAAISSANSDMVEFRFVLRGYERPKISIKPAITINEKAGVKNDL